MQENKDRKESAYLSWDDVTEAMSILVEMKRNGTIASDVIASVKKESAAKGIGIYVVAVISCVWAGVFGAIIYSQFESINKNNNQWQQTIERIDQGWRDYLSQYDFVTQDGEGYNYYNSDVGGDVNNGAAGPAAEE